MSTEAQSHTPSVAAAPPPLTRGWRWDIRSIRMMRFSLGLTAAVALSFAVQWPLYFLTPVLAATFLSMPTASPTLREGAYLFGYVIVAFGLGLVFTLFLLPYPLVYIPLLGVALFHIYYLLNRGGPAFLSIMCLLSVLILPMMAITQDVVATVIALYFSLSAGLAVAIYLLANGLIQEPRSGEPKPARAKRSREYSKPAAQAALKSTLVVLPLAIVFIAGRWQAATLLLIFAALFTLNPVLSVGRAAGKNSLEATLLGGLTAMVFMLFITAVPEYFFVMVLMFFSTLVFASNIFSAKPTARRFASAVSTFIILISSGTNEGASSLSAFLVRLGLIFLTTLYVVYALALLDRYWPRRGTVISSGT